jgi:hypothetical protein
MNMPRPNNYFRSFFVDSSHHSNLVATLSLVSLSWGILILEALINANGINPIIMGLHTADSPFAEKRAPLPQFTKKIVTALGNS